MNIQYGAKRSLVRPAHTMYCAMLFVMVYSMDLDYVTKMRYNKDKDLVFVTRPDAFWGESEHVYEMHHLEQMVPSAVTAIKDMSANAPDGILTVHDMSDKDYLKFYKEDKYWNLDLKDEFLSETNGLWQGNMSDKHSGRLFHTVNSTVSKDFGVAFNKIDQEMAQAV